MALLDEDTDGAFPFRPLLVLGILLLWPLVLWCWIRLVMATDRWASRYTALRAIHGKLAIGLALAIAAFLLGGALIKQSWRSETKPQEISPPEAS